MIDKTNNTNNSFSIESKNGYKTFTSKPDGLFGVHLDENGKRETYVARILTIEKRSIGECLAHITYVKDGMCNVKIWNHTARITDYSVNYPYITLQVNNNDGGVDEEQ